MKLKNLFFVTVALFLYGCDLDTQTTTNSYSQQRDSISATSVDLRKDIEENKVAGWSEAISLQDKYLTLINHIRTLPISCGGMQGPTTTLSWCGALYSAAKEHSEDMAANNHFSHTGSGTATDITAYNLGLSGGSSPHQRASYNGYKERLVFENIAKMPAESSDVSDDDIIKTMEYILKDSGHCKVIMNPKLYSFGMAEESKTINGKTYIFWTQDFGGS